MRSNNGLKVLFGFLFGHITDIALAALAVKSYSSHPVALVAFGGLFIALAIFFGIVAYGVDRDEEERMRREKINSELLKAQNERMKRAKT